jgi:putative hydrolase of the HAD superfamily
MHVEIVSDKNPASYAALLKRHNLKPASFMMVGNSLRSDILPVLALGARAVYIPYHLTWAHERVSPEELDGKRYIELEDLGQLVEVALRMKEEALSTDEADKRNG